MLAQLELGCFGLLCETVDCRLMQGPSLGLRLHLCGGVCTGMVLMPCLGSCWARGHPGCVGLNSCGLLALAGGSDMGPSGVACSSPAWQCGGLQAAGLAEPEWGLCLSRGRVRPNPQGQCLELV